MRVRFAFGNRFAGCLWLAMFSLGEVWAQAGPACHVSGVARDSAGAPVEGVKVTLTDQTGHVFATVLTSSNGAYAFDKVAGGDWQIHAERKGYLQHAPANVHLSKGQKVSIDLILDPWTGAATGHASASKSSSPVEFYQSSSLQADEVVGAVDPAGYSSPGDSNTTSLLLGGAAALRESSAANLAHLDPQASPGERKIYDRGAELLARHDAAAALEVFKTGLVQYPNSTDLRIGQGIALYLRGEYDEAVRSLIQATDLDPKAHRPYLFLADISAASPKESAAVTERLKRFYEYHPQDARAVFYFALSRWREMGGAGTREGWDEVEALLKKSIALDANFPDSHLQLGSLYANQNRYTEAIEQYRQTTALNPASAPAHYKLGQALERSGDREEAAKEFKLSESLRQPPGGEHLSTDGTDAVIDLQKPGGSGTRH